MWDFILINCLEKARPNNSQGHMHAYPSCMGSLALAQRKSYKVIVCKAFNYLIWSHISNVLTNFEGSRWDPSKIHVTLIPHLKIYTLNLWVFIMQWLQFTVRCNHDLFVSVIIVVHFLSRTLNINSIAHR